VKTDHGWLKDERGRTLLLRGVNLGGNSKTPTVPDGATHRPEGFFDHRMVSFVGRPFPLAEAEEHLARLKAWGFTFLRFLVTWEAVEHAGPGLYDTEYLEYLRKVVTLAGDMGFTLFIDPHQDVWSRFSGGDGAPGWTLEAAGLDMTHFAETCAAIVHQTHGDPFPRTLWITNALRLASATMFTLFFAGNDFAPRCQAGGEPIQEYLQRHYIDAMVQIARTLHGLPCVVGYDTFNEPSHGYIGWKDLNTVDSPLKQDMQPTALQSFALGDGLPQDVATWTTGSRGARQTGHRLINPKGVRAWREGMPCIWREHGVWGTGPEGRPQILQPDYFTQVHGRPVDFAQDYVVPFISRYAAAIHAVDPNALIFAEVEPNAALPRIPEGSVPGLVSAPHWYDGAALVLQRPIPQLGYDALRNRVVIGRLPVRRSFARQLRVLGSMGREQMHAPTVIGEIGIPMDMAGKTAYRTGNFRVQEAILDRSLAAVDAALCSSVLWNYAADNTNERGDGWNSEDFSLWSADQGRDLRVPDCGGRALRSAVRPYPLATCGEPLSLSFDIRRHILRYTFRHDPVIDVPTELFLPPFQYPFGYQVWTTDGTFLEDKTRHVLLYRHTLSRPTHTIIVRPRPAKRGHRR